MAITSWLRNLRSYCRFGTTTRKSRRAARCGPAKRFRLQLECLEDRLLPSAFTVTNLLDSGPDSLRAAIIAANANPGADTIDFATTGTIVLTSGQLDITDSLTINGPGAGQLTISGNDASRVFDITGSTTNVAIHDLTIAHGYGDGGAIYNAAVLTVSNSTLSLNTGIYIGGAIYNSGTLTVSNSALSENGAFELGGAIYNSGALTVSNSTLSGNGVGGVPPYSNPTFGGGIYMAAGWLSLSSSTISNNAAFGGSYLEVPEYEHPYTVGTGAFGGGLYVAWGTVSVSIDHSTIADNYAIGGPGDYPGTGYGGGIYNSAGPGVLQVYDTILADNSAEYSASDLSGGAASLGHNLIGNSTGGSGFAASDLLNVDPLLGPLQDNGGPTQTMALLPGSPAVNTGDNAGAPAYDQRGPGFPRVFAGAIDIGAFEAQFPSPPAVFISDVSLSEGNVGTTAAVFTVQISAASTETVLVHYMTADGSATVSDNDYQIQSGTLTFAAGETSKTITVLVNGDRRAESNENFVVNLSAPINAIIGYGQGKGTILDDEPRISIADVTVTEGNTGAVNATFTVGLSVAYDVPVTVHYQTANSFPIVTAIAGSDYTAASGDVTIAAGQTTQTFTVAVLGDRSAEPTETFVVNLSAPINAAIADAWGVCTIVDDEPRISISDVTKKEGNGKKTTLFTFTVMLSAAYDEPVTMSFATVNGTATTSDGDYLAKTGTLTFAPGETTKTITIEVKADSKKEASETFYLDLFGLSSNALFTRNRGLGTILSDD